MSRRWIALSALLIALAIIAGAFGAHALRDALSAYSMGVYEKAVQYHFLNALGLLMVSAMASQGIIAERFLTKVCWLLLAGVLIFSGSLYALALTDIKLLGAITPIGGTAFIAAWLLLAYGAYQANDNK